ncbi:MAG: DUF4132 domain-containing protein [Promethearchaeota archaeon]
MEEDQIKEFIEESYNLLEKEAKKKYENSWQIPLSKLKAYERIKKSSPDMKKAFIFYILKKRNKSKKKTRPGYLPTRYKKYAASKYTEDLTTNLFKNLIRYKIEYTEDELYEISSLLSSNPYYGVPLITLVRKIEEKVKNTGLSDILKKCLLLLTPERVYSTRDLQIQKEINFILSGKKKEGCYSVIDLLGKKIDQYLNSIPSSIVSEWHEFLNSLVNEGKKTRPTNKWLNESNEQIKKFLDKKVILEFQNWIEIVLNSIIDMHRNPLKTNSLYLQYQIPFEEVNINLIKGLIWWIGKENLKELLPLLDDLTKWSYKKFPGWGPIAMRLGNACIVSFSLLPIKIGVPYLSKHKSRIKHSGIRNFIDKHFKKSSDIHKASIYEIEEMGVPSFDLKDNFQIVENIGKIKAIIQIKKPKTIALSFEKENGTIQKSVPSSIKTTHKAEIQNIRKKIKDIKEAIITQSRRIEALYLTKRTWTYTEWEKNYLNHAFLSFFAQTLIWVFDSGLEKESAIYHNGKLINQEGKFINIDLHAARVCLWHPIYCSVKEIEDWRQFILEKEIVQPFKQAFREIYKLTEAEKKTKNYSNRFASHILKQYQFSALCSQNDWKFSLMGQWDSFNAPTKRISSHDITAEFEVTYDEMGGEVSSSFVHLHVITNHVRFYDNRKQLDLVDVPKIVFSEIMRDVDLFVSVSSIGTDPEWIDRGNEWLYDYWRGYSFGILSETAKIRKEVLEKIIPKLKISSQCSFTDKYLVIEGKLRTYKIHLGSGNVIMAPKDKYLCILIDTRKPKQLIYLPFEGDSLLNEILSKAMMLANDDKIKDRSIRGQIKKINLF